MIKPNDKQGGATLASRAIEESGTRAGAATLDIRAGKVTDCQTLGKTSYSRNVQLAERETAIATIHLIEGPVGAGKSTYAARLSLRDNAPHLNLDEWMVTLFSADRPDENFLKWYSDRKYRCIQQIWDVTCELLNSGTSAILELGLVRIADREVFYRRVDGTEYDLRVYLIDTPLEQRRQRVRERNAQKSGTYKMQVSDEVFDLANSFWQEPTEIEYRERNIETVSADQNDRSRPEAVR